MKKILLLPGLGDIHWVMLKLQSWLQRKGPEWEFPEVSVWNIDNRPRSLEFLQFIPWIKVGGYFNHPIVGQDKLKFDSVYTFKGSKDVVRDFHGYDVLIGMNGNMRNGVDFKTLLDGAEINYAYGPDLPAQNYGIHQKELGPYFVLCFSGFGMFSRGWTNRILPDKVKSLVSALRVKFPSHRFLFSGCEWDNEFTKLCMRSWDVSLVGKTTLPQFLSLLQHADGYIGWCGGNAIMAQHLGVPTVAWWSRNYFLKHDRNGWETPHAKPVHLVLETEDFKDRETAEQIVTFLEAARG